METQIEKLSQWIEHFSLGDVPSHTVEQAKLQVLDCLASINAGFRCNSGKKIYRALKHLSDSVGDHIIFPTGERWSLENAVYLHSALINSLELDNFCYMGHLSESVFPVAVAITEKLDGSNKDFLESLICAQEVSGRLAAYMASGPLQGHMRSFIHRIGGAVATAKLYKCPSGIIANAIAISLSSPELPMFPTSFSPETKITCVSSATVEGMRSAFLAMEGFDATRDVIEHPAGFVKSFSRMNHAPEFWRTLGKTWVMDSISFKYYASCGYSQGPVNATLNAIQSKNIMADDIKAIHIHSPLLTVLMEGFSHPHYQSDLTPVNINFSTKRSVSSAILYGKLDGSFFADGNDELYYEQITELSKKVFIHHSWKYTIGLIMGMDACLENAGYPGAFDTGSTDKTLKYLKKVYKNRTIFEWSDIKDLMSLPPGHLQYLAKRVVKSKLGKMGLTSLKSYEKDLTKLKFKTGATVEIHTGSGAIISGTCDIPKGFAGDPDKKTRVIEKFERECSPVYGHATTALLLKDILTNGYPRINFNS